MITGLAHIAINVADMERSLRFYHGTLGLPLGEEMNLPDGRRLVNVKLGGDVTVELIGRPAPLDEHPEGECVGLIHLALAVDNIDALYGQLRVQGVRFTVPPRAISPRMKIAFLLDPDGVLVELVER